MTTITDTNSILCGNYAKSSSEGTVEFWIENQESSAIEFDFDCTYWGDATSCDLDNWDSEELEPWTWTTRTATWDVNSSWTNPGGTHPSGVEFFAWEYKIHVDDVSDGYDHYAGWWWNPGGPAAPCDYNIN